MRHIGDKIAPHALNLLPVGHVPAQDQGLLTGKGHHEHLQRQTGLMRRVQKQWAPEIAGREVILEAGGAHQMVHHLVDVAPRIEAEMLLRQ